MNKIIFYTFNYSDGTVSYDLFKEYYHLPEKSKGNVFEDSIIIPNIPLFAAGSSMKDAGYFTLMGFKATMSTMLGDEALHLFVKKTTNDILWGYDDKLTEIGKTFSEGLKSDKFGLFVGKNFSVDGRVRTHTGENDLDMLGQVFSFNGKENYGIWPDKECDKMKGNLRTCSPD